MTISPELQLFLDATLLLGLFVMLVMNWRIQGYVKRALDAVNGTSIAERWVTAVAFLGRDGEAPTSTVETRLGGIYAVEQIARESQAYRAPTMELLATDVRRHAPLARTGIEPEVEIQSILTVLARSGVEGLDLRRTALWGIDLENASLVGVDLSDARIGGACFAGMKLARARMRDALLTDANLAGADLSGASLVGARLAGADLTGTDLRGADLKGVDLRRARLRGADLERAELAGATMSGASTRGSSWHGARLVGAILPDDMLRRKNERSSD